MSWKSFIIPVRWRCMAGKGKHSSAGLLFWLAFSLLMAVLFFLNRRNIDRVFSSAAVQGMFGNQDSMRVFDSARRSQAGSAVESDAKATLPTQDVAQPDAPVAGSPAPADAGTEGKDVGTVSGAPGSAQQSRAITLCWVRIDADGKITREEVARTLPHSTVPLSDALRALFLGPSEAEAVRGLRTLIPEGTRLRSARVQEGVAVLDLSEEFQFNQYGIEGYLAQLSQVVFTAAAFPTVHAVQFLIEGRRTEYLGSEGMWIGAPVSKSSF